MHEPKRLPAKPEDGRLREIEKQIRMELTEQILRTRASQSTQKPRVNRLIRLVETIDSGLHLFERRASGIDASIGGGGGVEGYRALETEIREWRRKVEQATPPGGVLRGRPAHFTYTDAKRIRKYMLSATKYATIGQEGHLDYVVSVKCIGFWGGAVSVWVFFGVVETVGEM